MNKPTVHATPSVALVGRKNVGKSSLFNRLIEDKQALVSPIPGTTRDVNVGFARWRGQMLTLLDTGGLDIAKKDVIEVNVKRQALRAAEKAHVIIFVVDAKTGPLSTDLELARELRRVKRPVILVVNKADTPARRAAVGNEWKKLGFGAPVTVSAANGGGTGDLLDRVFEELKKIELPLDKLTPDLTITFLGRPNVGKSSLLNALCGEERVIVSEIPHTTREPQDTLLFYGDKKILVVDTAGIRKHARIDEGLEKESVEKSLEKLKESDVIILVLDAADALAGQDKHLAGMAEASGKGVIVVMNKWDKIGGKKSGTIEDYKRSIAVHFPFLEWVPILFTSALTGQRVDGLLDLALQVKTNRERQISAEDLDKFGDTVIKPYVTSRTPHHRDALGSKKRHPKVYGIRQTGVSPTEFTLVVKDKTVLDKSYLRWVENRLREKWDFRGVPIFVKSREIE